MIEAGHDAERRRTRSRVLGPREATEMPRKQPRSGISKDVIAINARISVFGGLHVDYDRPHDPGRSCRVASTAVDDSIQVAAMRSSRPRPGIALPTLHQHSTRWR